VLLYVDRKFANVSHFIPPLLPSLCVVAAAGLILARADSVLAGAGLRSLPNSGAAWSRFAFAPQGFRRFVLVHAFEAGTAKPVRLLSKVRRKIKLDPTRLYSPTVAVHKVGGLQLETGRQRGVRMEDATRLGAARVVPGRTVLPAASSSRVDEPVQTASVGAERLQRSVKLRGRTDGARRRKLRSRAHVVLRGRLAIPQKRPPPKVYSYLMETPDWARKAFRVD